MPLEENKIGEIKIILSQNYKYEWKLHLNEWMIILIIGEIWCEAIRQQNRNLETP